MTKKSMVVSVLVAVAATACGSVPSSDESVAATTVVSAQSDSTAATTDSTAAASADRSSASTSTTDAARVATTTTTSTTSTTKPPVAGSSGEGAPVTGEAPDSVIQAVLEAAESHTGVDRRTMTLLKAQAVTFSDGSLNCPEPGMLYTQALINGYWIQVDVDGVILDYRVSDRSGMKLCESGGTEPLPRQDS